MIIYNFFDIINFHLIFKYILKNIKDALSLDKEKFTKKNVEAVLMKQIPSDKIKEITSTPLRTLRMSRQGIQSHGPKKLRRSINFDNDFEVNSTI